MKEKQPRQGDMVLGGKNLPPKGAAVLGGIKGFLHKLNSENEQEQLAAINQALNYGKYGLELVIKTLTNESVYHSAIIKNTCLNVIIKALNNNSVELQKKAYLFLQNRKETKVKEALANCNFYPFFECIDTLQGHSDSVFSLAITPNGERLVSLSRDKTIKIWDFSNKNLLYSLSTLDLHSEAIISIAITPNGEKIIGATKNNAIKILDLTGVNSFSSFKADSKAITSLTITPNGKRLIGGNEDGSIKIWNLNPFLYIYKFKGHLETITFLDITPDGKRLISASKSQIKIWNLTTFKNTYTQQKPLVTPFVITPNGKNIISSGRNNTLKIWDLNTGKCLSILKTHSSWIETLVITSDGKKIVTGSGDNTIKIWGIPKP